MDGFQKESRLLAFGTSIMNVKNFIVTNEKKLKKLKTECGLLSFFLFQHVPRMRRSRVGLTESLIVLSRGIPVNRFPSDNEISSGHS